MQNILQISRRVDYGLRAIIHLAKRIDPKPVSFKEIARVEDIPKDFLAKILRTLVDAGLVNSTRGPHGGFSLAKSPADVSFLDIIEAIEGPIVLNVCLGDDSICSRSTTCTMKSVWQRGQEKMLEVFRDTLLADVVAHPPLLAVPSEAA